jgi:hypothetical protein
VRYEAAMRHLRFTVARPSCLMKAEVEVASIGFSWKSDPLERWKSDLAIIGGEVTGPYYDS